MPKLKECSTHEEIVKSDGTAAIYESEPSKLTKVLHFVTSTRTRLCLGPGQDAKGTTP